MYIRTYIPRNINSLTKDSTKKERYKLDYWFRKRLKVPIITSIEAVLLYKGRYFWKIDSHTGTEGAKLRKYELNR